MTHRDAEMADLIAIGRVMSRTYDMYSAFKVVTSVIEADTVI
jgi:hypothetical protein